MDECVTVQNMLDGKLFSYTDYGDSQGAVWRPSVKQMSTWARSYARAIAGRPINMTFDVSKPTKDFEFCFELDRTIDAPTEIFASKELHYPDGLHIRTTTNIRVENKTMT